MTNATGTKKITASQEKTLAYIRKNGRVMVGVLSSGHGYNSSSVDALIKKGILVETRKHYDIITYDGRTVPSYTTFADFPAEVSK